MNFYSSHIYLIMFGSLYILSGVAPSHFIYTSDLSIQVFMEETQLHQPLLPLVNHEATTATISTATNTGFLGLSSTDGDKIISSNIEISLRLLLILIIGVISIWANHEASKGFVIRVINNTKNTRAGEKFSIFYVSNDEAVRLVQSSSTFATKVLFPRDSSMPEKLIDEVNVQLVSHNLTNFHSVDVKSFVQRRKYVLSISSHVMEFRDFKYRIRKEIQRGMAEILLFHQQNKAPKTLLDGMVEYVSDLAGFGDSEPVMKLRDSGEKCWEDEDPRVVAKILAYGERKSEGFVEKLNQEMNRDGWFEGMMDKAVGIPAFHLCASFHDSMIMSQPVRKK